MERFTNTVDSIFTRQDVLEQENQHLTQLRDWLLPILMNGRSRWPKGEAMKFEEFVSGSYKQQYQHKSFQPAPISAAVTGKIAVRNWQPAQAEPPREASA